MLDCLHGSASCMQNAVTVRFKFIIWSLSIWLVQVFLLLLIPYNTTLWVAVFFSFLLPFFPSLPFLSLLLSNVSHFKSCELTGNNLICSGALGDKLLTNTVQLIKPQKSEIDEEFTVLCLGQKCCLHDALRKGLSIKMLKDVFKLFLHQNQTNPLCLALVYHTWRYLCQELLQCLELHFVSSVILIGTSTLSHLTRPCDCFCYGNASLTRYIVLWKIERDDSCTCRLF